MITMIIILAAWLGMVLAYGAWLWIVSYVESLKKPFRMSKNKDLD